jgi:glycerol-3-phosphate acyltransferase PlsY
MLGTATLPLSAAVTDPSNAALMTFGLFMTAFVAFTHRANIARMRRGTENRARKLWLLRPR